MGDNRRLGGNEAVTREATVVKNQSAEVDFVPVIYIFGLSRL